jgi:hypothetical protein
MEKRKQDDLMKFNEKIINLETGHIHQGGIEGEVDSIISLFI